MTAQARALLLDTHAAIWFVEGTLDPAVVDEIVFAGLADGVFVSPVSAWEVGLLARERRPGEPPKLQFLPDAESWFARLMAKSIIKPAPLTNAIAIAASFLPALLHNDPADRLLIATARRMNIAIMTRDRTILDYGAAGNVQTRRC